MEPASPETPAQRATRLEYEYQGVLDAMVDAVFIIDARGTIELVNQAGERLFDYREEELIGKNFSMLVSEPYGTGQDSLQQSLQSGEPHVIGSGREVHARRRDGSTFAVDLSIGLIRGSDPQRFVGFMRDITDRQNAEDKVRQLQDRLTHFGRISTMGEMAAGIAHEINQPLTAIATYAQACQRMLADPSVALTPELLQGLERIESQALRAGEVIRRLRSFVRNREVRREPIDPNRLLDDLLMLAQTDTRHHSIRIRLEQGAGLPLVQADAVQIQQVILNLVRNGIDAMSELAHDRRELHLRTRLDENGDVEFMVSDLGPGLSEAAQQELFNPFFTTKPAGTGLGLAISLSIVRAHGGKVWYRPGDKGGACFLFSLPAVTV
jgi:two-component system sensor kinase FixL